MTDKLVPRPVSASDTIVLGAAKAMSYGPRVEPYDDGIVVPAKSAEDVARRIAEALARDP